MEIEYYDLIDFGMLAPFREKMQERIFCKKRNDGQKGQKTHGQLGKAMQKLDSDFQQKLNEFIDNAERYNIHPNELNKINPLLSFYSFNLLNTTKEYITLFGDTDEPLQVVLENGEYFEQSFLDELIKKWFESNGKEYPKDDSEVEFFYDNNLSYLIDVKKNVFNDDNYRQYISKSRIYTFRKNKVQNLEGFELLKQRFWEDFSEYKNKSNELEKDLEYSDRGNIIVDDKNPYGFIYKLNGKDIYQFASKHFWEIYDEFIMLQTNQPYLFGKGAESILVELHKTFSSKNETYWGTFEAFKLKVQQQYLYTANEEKGLRLDLYRNILDNGDFEGGLWHSFKHFKVNNLPLSGISAGGKEYSENHFFMMLRRAFFVDSWKKDNKNRFNVTIPYLSEREGDYTFGFYENNCLNNQGKPVLGFYSLNTVKYSSKS